MNILVQYFFGGDGTGALEHFKVLLSSYQKRFPNDRLFVVCRPHAKMNSIVNLNPNIQIIHYGGKLFFEIERLFLHVVGFKKIIRDYNIDLMWNVNVGSYVRLNVPQVVSLSNAFVVYPLDDIITHIETFRRKISLIFMRLFFQISLKNVDLLTVQSLSMKSAVEQFTNIPVIVISKSVDNKSDYQFREISSSDNISLKKVTAIKEGTVRLLYVSNYYLHKNHKTLIDLMCILRDRSIKSTLILTLTEKLIIEKFGSMAKALIDSGHIQALGWVGKNYLESLYSHADIVVIPSLLESFSSAHIEAMQFSKPIITSNMPFSREICGKSAVYVSPTDASKWADAVVALINNPNERSYYIVQGKKQLATFPYSWDVIATNLNRLFRGLINYQ